MQRFDVPEDGDGVWTAIQDLRHAIEDARAADSYTYLFEAVDKGLEVLREFKEKNPGHSRHIILVSDGKQLTPRDKPSNKSMNSPKPRPA